MKVNYMIPTTPIIFLISSLRKQTLTIHLSLKRIIAKDSAIIFLIVNKGRRKKISLLWNFWRKDKILNWSSSLFICHTNHKINKNFKSFLDWCLVETTVKKIIYQLIQIEKQFCLALDNMYLNRRVGYLKNSKIFLPNHFKMNGIKLFKILILKKMKFFYLM